MSNPTLTALESIGHARIELVPYFTDEPKYPSVFCTPKPDAPYLRRQVYGLSVHPDMEIARLMSLAEFYERACLNGIDRRGEPEPYRPGSDQLDPARFDYRPEPGDPKEIRAAKLRWIEATSWPDGETVRLPLQNVIPYVAEEEEIALAPNLSPGGAALGGLGDGGAFRRGLYEMVERHASRRSTADRSRAARIQGWPEVSLPMVEYLERYRLHARAVDLGDYYGVPSVMIALLDRSGVASSITVSHRTASNYGDALSVGLLESIERRRPARLEQEIKFAEHLGPDKSAGKRLFMWTDLEELEQFEPWFESLPVRRLDDLAEIVTTPEETGRRLIEQGCPIYVVNLSLPEVEAAGFEGIRVIIPELGRLY